MHTFRKWAHALVSHNVLVATDGWPPAAHFAVVCLIKNFGSWIEKLKNRFECLKYGDHKNWIRKSNSVLDRFLLDLDAKNIILSGGKPKRRLKKEFVALTGWLKTT